MYSLKLEIKLNNKERSRLSGCAGFQRFAYNFGLSVLTSSWQWAEVKASDAKRFLAIAKRCCEAQIEKVFTNHVKTNPDYAWMKQYPSAIYSQAFRNLRAALGRWRKGESGFPQFKRKKDRDSFTVLKKAGMYPTKGKPMLPFSNKQVLYPGKRIIIPGLGEFRLKQPIPYLCASQTFTISRIADRWYVSFVLEVEKVPPTHHEIESVGIDLGVKQFATLSDGTTITAPPSLKQAKTKLGKEQWRNRNKQHGDRSAGVATSSNAKKFYRRLGRRHSHIANIRKDFLQKVTTDISRKYYRIRIEDLNISGMIANHKLASAVSSCGFYEFRRMLTYKEPFYGTRVELVDRWYPSSKRCSECGHIQPMPLSERVYRCNQCGCEKDRDYNASLNLEQAPSDRVRRATAELTPVDKKRPTSLDEAGSKRQNK